MEYGKIVVGRKKSTIENEIGDEISGLSYNGTDWYGSGYEVRGYKLMSFGDFEHKDKYAFDDDEKHAVYGIEVVSIGNGAVKINESEIQERISKAKELFKERIGIEGEVWIIGYQK